MDEAAMDEATVAHIAELMVCADGPKGDRVAAWLAGIESLDALKTGFSLGPPRAFVAGDGVRMANGAATIRLSWMAPQSTTLIDCLEASQEFSCDPLDYDDLPDSLFWSELAADHKNGSPETRAWVESYTAELEDVLERMVREDIERCYPEATAAVAAAGLTPASEFIIHNLFDYVFGIEVELPLRPDRARYAPIAWRQLRYAQSEDRSPNACGVCGADYVYGAPDPPVYYPLCPGCSPVAPSEGEPKRVACTLCDNPTFLRLRLCESCRPHRAPKRAE